MLCALLAPKMQRLGAEGSNESFSEGARKRTRANYSLVDVAIEELEAGLRADIDEIISQREGDARVAFGMRPRALLRGAASPRGRCP